MEKRMAKLEAEIKELKNALVGSNEDSKTQRGRTDTIEQRMKGS